MDYILLPTTINFCLLRKCFFRGRDLCIDTLEHSFIAENCGANSRTPMISTQGSGKAMLASPLTCIDSAPPSTVSRSAVVKTGSSTTASRLTEEAQSSFRETTRFSGTVLENHCIKQKEVFKTKIKTLSNHLIQIAS